MTKLDQLLWRIPKKYPPHRQTSMVETSACVLRVRDSGGAGRPLVFLCDPPITVEAYDDLLAAFSSEYRVIVIELPSFGFSRITSSSALSFDGAVEALEEAIAAMDLRGFVLFGPCICGFVAATLAKRSRLPIKGLVLLQTPDREGMLSWVGRMDPRGLLRTPFLGQLIVRLSARRMAKFWLSYATARAFDAHSLIERSDCVLAQGGGYPLATMLQGWTGGAYDAGLNVPSLAIWGKQDRSHKCTPSASTRKHVPDATIMEFPECGHFTELERPEEFVASVLPFVQTCFGAPVEHHTGRVT